MKIAKEKSKQPYKYKCKFCPETSKTKEIMKQHILHEHEEDIMFENIVYNGWKI